MVVTQHIQAFVRHRGSRLVHTNAADLAIGEAAAELVAARGHTAEVAARCAVIAGAAQEWFAEAVNQVHCLLGTDCDRVDPLVALARHDPFQTAWFIQVLMLVGGIFSALVSVTLSVFIFFSWSSSASCCDRPLRQWLLVQMWLQVAQAPMRLKFAAQIHAERHMGDTSLDSSATQHMDAERLQHCVVAMAEHWTWSVVRIISFFTYAWLGIGLIWVMNASPCEGCPCGLRAVCIAMIVLCCLRAMLVAEFFNRLFGRASVMFEEQTHDGECSDTPVGATPDEIASLPKFCYGDIKNTSIGSNHSVCVVCCAEYNDQDLCRKLPCGHHFHQQCVDKWLQRSTRCPLCMGTIREAPSGKLLTLGPPSALSPASSGAGT